MSFTQNPQIDPDQFGDAMRHNHLVAHLDEKFKDRPFREENAWWYTAANVSSYLFQAINIASGFSRPFAYLTGIFAIGAVGGVIAFLIAGFFVVGIEWAARKNLTQLLEKNFFKKRLYGSRVFAQVVLNGAIIALSYWGAPDAVRIVSGEFVAKPPALEDQAAIRQHYAPLIATAQKNADDFKASSSWNGKLSPANQRRYDAKLQEVARLTAEMNGQVIEAQNRNRTAIGKADEIAALDAQKKAETDAFNGNVFAIISVISCLLFTLMLWLKEFFEYRAALELVQEGKLKNQRFTEMLAKAESTISDREARDALRREFGPNGILNHAETPLPQSNRPIGFNIDRSGNVLTAEATPAPAASQAAPDEVLFKQTGDLFKQILGADGKVVGLMYKKRNGDWQPLKYPDIRSRWNIYARRNDNKPSEAVAAGREQWTWAMEQFEAGREEVTATAAAKTPRPNGLDPRRPIATQVLERFAPLSMEATEA